MTIDINKLPPKVLRNFFILVFTVLGLVAWVLVVSYKNSQPLMIGGLEYGFGSNKLTEVVKEYEKYKENTKVYIRNLEQELSSIQYENTKLKEINLQFTTDQQARFGRDSAMWFPVDDVQFKSTGAVASDTMQVSAGRWFSKDKDLALSAFTIGYNELVLLTNLPAPGDKIRLDNDGLIAYTSKWEYKLKLLSAHGTEANIRVERRSRK